MKQIFLIVLLFCFGYTASAQVCESLFGDSELYRTIRSLAELRLRLDFAQTSNEDSITISLLRTQYAEKENALLSYVSENRLMTTAELLQQIKNQINIIQKARQAEEIQNKIKRQTQDINNAAVIGSRAVFNRIESGKFLMGPPDAQREVEIENSFEMMSTTITQIVWRELANLATKHGFIVPKAEVPVIGDLRPISNLSWKQVNSFIQAINKISKAGTPELKKILIGHKDGDQYDLPTETEWEFVARARGKFKGKYPFDNDSLVGEVAWFGLDAKVGFQEVGLKSPVIIDGLEFYDMLGNIREWTSTLSPRKDEAAVRGNNYYNSNIEDTLYKKVFYSTDSSSSLVSIRLVRRLK